jgi:RHS repeat-associated protein
VTFVVDELLAQENLPASGSPSADDLYWILQDRLQSVGDAYNAAGTVNIHNDYDAFGECYQTETDYGGSIAATDIPRYNYTCQEQEPLFAGLLYYNARWYDTNTGRFLSEDSLGFDAGYMNLYVYCGNNSINLTDPTGHCSYGSSWGSYGVTSTSQYLQNIIGPTSFLDYNVSGINIAGSGGGTYIPNYSTTATVSQPASYGSNISQQSNIQKINLAATPQALNANDVVALVKANYPRDQWSSGVLNVSQTTSRVGGSISPESLLAAQQMLKEDQQTLNTWSQAIQNPGPMAPSKISQNAAAMQELSNYMALDNVQGAGRDTAYIHLMTDGRVETVVDRSNFPLDAKVGNTISNKTIVRSGPFAAEPAWGSRNNADTGNPLDAFQTTLDIVGTFDPTPITDSINGVISAFRGNYGAAATSVVAAFIPYAGDTLKAGKVAVKAINGNSKLSTRTAHLYGLYEEAGEFLKWGVTQDMSKRYTKSFVKGKYMDEVMSGSRAEMLKVERNMVEINPGPLNREPWAGKRKVGQ